LRNWNQTNNAWKPFLDSQTKQPYYQDLQAYLASRKEAGAIIYPSQKDVFNAFELTPLNKIKVVILGQDPYPNEGEAHGLCFSVKNKKAIPASLTRIYKELNTDLGYDIPRSGDLTQWAENGVFLLNTILTVEHKSAGAHRDKGWEVFTDAAIRHISENRKQVVFMLWGSFAHKKIKLIDEGKHKILKASHPVASVKNGFYGTKPFSKANEFLDEELDWSL
jgi:uracil-DNA glycosylase